MTEISRNAPCSCGSGKKFKHCCGSLEGKHAVKTSDSAQASIPEYLQKGLEYHQTGQLAEAEAVYRQILRMIPDHPDALYLSGLAAYEAGRCKDAVEQISKAIHISPVGPFYYGLGNALFKLGMLDEAVESFREALRLAPDIDAAYFSLGNALRAQGKLDEAIENFRKALLLKPDFVEACNNLGVALKDQGRLDEAIESFRKALLLKPGSAEMHNNLGIALREHGDMDGAIGSFRKALELRPDYAEAANNLGNALQEQNSLDAAIACYREALKLNPDLMEAHSNLGNALREQGSLDAALESLHKALALENNCIGALNGLAGIYLDRGQFEMARDSIGRVLALEPDHPAAWAALPALQKMTDDDLTWAEKARHLLAGRLKPHEEIALYYALGKYYDDTRQYDAAFDCYEQANHLKRRQICSFDRDEFRSFVDDIIHEHPYEIVRQQHGSASASCLPLMVVGMPRSGTSLMEQILASHPDIFGAGELHFWRHQADDHRAMMSSWCRNSALLQDISRQCEAELRRYSRTALRVVDKMPGNFLYLGLIHAVFPQARILHMQRNPVDTCLSIYFQAFSNQYPYANDLEDLVFYYREYLRMMAHWRVVLPPEVFMEVPYEALVEDQEGWSRRIIDFTGLPWNERCLNFHETERRVGTPSNWQVRQKIYSTSKERWRNYEKFAGPLLCLLESAG